jgi:hypothetical protein
MPEIVDRANVVVEHDVWALVDEEGCCPKIVVLATHLGDKVQQTALTPREALEYAKRIIEEAEKCLD